MQPFSLYNTGGIEKLQKIVVGTIKDSYFTIFFMPSTYLALPHHESTTAALLSNADTRNIATFEEHRPPNVLVRELQALKRVLHPLWLLALKQWKLYALRQNVGAPNMVGRIVLMRETTTLERWCCEQIDNLMR